METIARPVHKLTTAHSAETVEARDTSIDPLPFAIDPMHAEGDKYQAGDPVVLTSSDGAVFIGHLSDAETDRLRIYVELD